MVILLSVKKKLLPLLIGILIPLLLVSCSFDTEDAEDTEVAKPLTTDEIEQLSQFHIENKRIALLDTTKVINELAIEFLFGQWWQHPNSSARDFIRNEDDRFDLITSAKPQAWSATAATLPDTPAVSCPSEDFTAFLNEFSNNPAVQKSYTLPSIRTIVSVQEYYIILNLQTLRMQHLQSALDSNRLHIPHIPSSPFFQEVQVLLPHPSEEYPIKHTYRFMMYQSCWHLAELEIELGKDDTHNQPLPDSFATLTTCKPEKFTEYLVRHQATPTSFNFPITYPFRLVTPVLGSAPITHEQFDPLMSSHINTLTPLENKTPGFQNQYQLWKIQTSNALEYVRDDYFEQTEVLKTYPNHQSVRKTITMRNPANKVQVRFEKNVYGRLFNIFNAGDYHNITFLYLDSCWHPFEVYVLSQQTPS